MHDITKEEGYLEGGQTVQSGKVLNVSRSDVETRSVPGAANMPFRQDTCSTQEKHFPQTMNHSYHSEKILGITGKIDETLTHL